MIPNKIHYIWFGGGAKSASMQALIAGWKEMMPNHEVIEWNEQNLDIGLHPYMQKMHAEKKYSFASDLARLLVLKRHGGIYLDTDVLIKKPIDPFCAERCFLGFEFNHFISTCIMAAEAGHPLIDELLRQYDGRTEPIINNILVTEHLMECYPEFRLNNRDQTIGAGIRIMPKEYFVVPGFSDHANFSVHHANNHWNDEDPTFSPGGFVRALIGKVLFYKLVNLKLRWSSNFPAMERERLKAMRKK